MIVVETWPFRCSLRSPFVRYGSFLGVRRRLNNNALISVSFFFSTLFINFYTWRMSIKWPFRVPNIYCSVFQLPVLDVGINFIAWCRWAKICAIKVNEKKRPCPDVGPLFLIFQKFHFHMHNISARICMLKSLFYTHHTCTLYTIHRHKFRMKNAYVAWWCFVYIIISCNIQGGHTLLRCCSWWQLKCI